MRALPARHAVAVSRDLHARGVRFGDDECQIVASEL